MGLTSLLFLLYIIYTKILTITYKGDEKLVVTLIGKNSIHKVALPEIAVGNYWLSDKSSEVEKKLINIEGRNGSWQIVSNSYSKIINPRWIKANNEKAGNNFEPKVISKAILTNYSMNYISLGNSDELYILYCAPIYENNFERLEIKSTSEVSIGSGKDNDIMYDNPLTKSKHARIFYFNGRWTIENLDSQFGTFVNDNPVSTDNQILFNGDVIFIMGLKIIIMGKSLFINNPLNKVTYNLQNLVPNRTKVDFSKLKKEDDSDEDLYIEKEYFARAPRITNVIERRTVKIDAPPQIQSKEEMPIALVLGSTLTMGVMMMVSVIMSIDGLVNGKASMKETVFSLIISVAMLISMLLFPILNVKYEKKQKKKYELKRQNKYKKYINSKVELIDDIMNQQRKILFDNYVSAEDCTKIILNRGPRLWERKVEDPDFLTVRIGIGDVPLDIDIQYPEEHFSMEDDNLVEILNEIANKSKILEDAPITIPLAEKSVSALVVKDDEEVVEKFMQSLIMQFITFHSYEDLKLVFLVKKDIKEKWDYVKMLPHIWDNSKQIRFFADDYNDMKEISSYLEEELRNRKRYEEELNYKSFSPYYLIITDDYKKIENLKIITEILKEKVNVGFSIFCITNNLMQLPNECKTFINIDKKEGMLFESEISSTNQRKFTFDSYQTFFFEKISKKIANIPIKYTESGIGLLPNTYTFLEMYDVGRIEQLNILERWKTNNSVMSLQAPIGIDASGMPITLDIHEKFHGPHGLIAGSTGSGKSEFIITYILSLAINYHPDDLAFILIDYKGGGLAGAFKKNEIKLPHLVGTITNIETAGLQRSLASIQSELRRREHIFNEARNKTDEGTMDIYKYQRLYHEGIVKKPVPHLLIICDEFAELKQQQEDFMDELISVARIGRSLGVHLILATQKPAGVVNDQIRSNCNFGICLKVQDREDSVDIIKRPDAASLKQAGRFYLQVGNDEYCMLGQSAWAGAPYIPSNITKKKVDNSITFISNIGKAIKEVGSPLTKEMNSKGEQLTNIVKYIYELAKQENIKTNQLWLDNIPEIIYIKQLRRKYHIETEKNNINPIIGEYDDPFNQRQGIVGLNLSSEGNTIIYGNTDSGKETLLSTMVYDLMTTHTSDEVQLYLLDFGSEALKIFKDSPHVGDVVFMNDTEKIRRLFDMLKGEIKSRKAILSDYNGNYNLYINTEGKTMPMFVITINNYEAFYENYGDDYEDDFLTLTREGLKCGIVFIITANTYHDIRYRLAQNFKQKIVLQLNNEDDYLSIFDGVGKKRPSHIFGRGLVKLGDIYEFQTAKICDPKEWNVHIKGVIEKLNKTNNTPAKTIPVLPSIVTLKDVNSSLKDLSEVPLGIIKKSLNIFKYNFQKKFITIITSKNIELVIEFSSNIIEEIKKLNNINIVVLDAERVLQTKKNIIIDSYKNIVSEMDKEIKENSKRTLCVIIGIDKFINDLENGEEEFNQMLKKAAGLSNYNFIIIENATRLKNHEYDDWYKNHITGDSGIWIGNGINDQYLISTDSNGKDIINDCGNCFGYVIEQGSPTLIKLLGMKGVNSEDE